MSKYKVKQIEGKLMLTSFDIQVGDTTYPLEGAKSPEGYTLENSHDVTVFKTNRAFKVVGEISPDATWVKDGDEFTEDMFRYTLNGEEFIPNHKEVFEGYIQIKSWHCGHFH